MIVNRNKNKSLENVIVLLSFEWCFKFLYIFIRWRFGR